MIALDNDRAITVEIDGAEYPLLFTMLALREVNKKYGGVSEMMQFFGTTEPELENDRINGLIWLTALLINQPIMIYNLANADKKPLVTEEEIFLKTTPVDMFKLLSASTKAVRKGTTPKIKSEDAKNGESA